MKISPILITMTVFPVAQQVEICFKHKFLIIEIQRPLKETHSMLFMNTRWRDPKAHREMYWR